MPELSKASQALNHYIEGSGVDALSEDQLRGFLQKEKIFAYQIKPLTVSRRDPTASGAIQLFLKKNAPHYHGVGYHKSKQYETVLLIKQPVAVTYKLSGQKSRKTIRIKGDVRLRTFSHLFLYIREPNFKIKQLLVPIIDNQIRVKYILRQRGTYIFELVNRRNDDPIILAKFPITIGQKEDQQNCTLDNEESLLKEINRIRYLNGGKRLILSQALSRVAELHSYEMAKRSYFSHISPLHGTPYQRVKSGNIKFTKIVENISKARTLCGAHQEILASPGHLKNLLDREIDTIGLGIVREEGIVYLTENMIKSPERIKGDAVGATRQIKRSINRYDHLRLDHYLNRLAFQKNKNEYYMQIGVPKRIPLMASGYRSVKTFFFLMHDYQDVLDGLQRELNRFNRIGYDASEFKINEKPFLFVTVVLGLY